MGQALGRRAGAGALEDQVGDQDVERDVADQVEKEERGEELPAVAAEEAAEATFLEFRSHDGEA